MFTKYIIPKNISIFFSLFSPSLRIKQGFRENLLKIYYKVCFLFKVIEKVLVSSKKTPKQQH